MKENISDSVIEKLIQDPSHSYWGIGIWAQFCLILKIVLLMSINVSPVLTDSDQNYPLNLDLKVSFLGEYFGESLF